MRKLSNSLLLYEEEKRKKNQGKISRRRQITKV